MHGVYSYKLHHILLLPQWTTPQNLKLIYLQTAMVKQYASVNGNKISQLLVTPWLILSLSNICTKYQAHWLSNAKVIKGFTVAMATRSLSIAVVPRNSCAKYEVGMPSDS